MLEKRKLVETFLNLVTIDSESRSEGEISSYVKGLLEKQGLEVTIDSANKHFDGEVGNLIAFLPGKAPDHDDDFFEKPILLAAHLDTVAPGKNVRPKHRDDVITSSGPTILGADDKAGIAVIVHVLEEITKNELPHPPLEVVCTVSEEIGLCGSRHLDYTKLAAKDGISLDASTVGSFVVSAPFKAVLDVELQGLSAHAADPHLGINAIQVAATAVSKMHLGLIDDETTCNIGTFTAVGPINIVPDRVNLQIEVRSRSEDKLLGHIDHLNRCLREGAASFVARRPEGERRPVLSATTTRLYDGYTIPEDDPFLRRMMAAADFLDIDAQVVAGMGGTDANNYMAHGIRTINMGVGIHEAHTTREWLSTYELFKAARLLLKILTNK